MLKDILPFLLLSFAIALTWSRFRTIFSPATDDAVLRSPPTMLASAICLSSVGLAFDTETFTTGGLIVALGILLPGVTGKHSARAPMALALGLASAFLICYLWMKASL
ncbi:MAG: hypothetical protein JWL86_6595 [Rhizobium sp.]|nr:hypothetical protein [Rhizobium sp.]